MKQRMIKFRAWNGIDEQFVHFDLDDEVQSNGRPIMQFTGLLDKNGKEIYEGDIVKFNHSGVPIYTSLIEWHDNGWWMVDAQNRHHLPNEEYREIIGNIYETPELLK